MAVSVLSWVYSVVAIVFLVMTFLESWTNHDGWRPARFGGLLLCLAWPVVLVAILVHAVLAALFAGMALRTDLPQPPA